MRHLLVTLVLFLACSAPEVERAYISGLEPCGATAGDGGSGATGGSESGGTQTGGTAGQAGDPQSPGCFIDDPIAIAEAYGLTVQLYYIADDPELSGVTAVGTWNERVFGRDLIAKNTATGPVVDTIRPSRTEADSTLGNRASIKGDGVDDRLIENTWNGPLAPSQTNPWGFVQLSVKYGTWKRARQGWGSQQLPTRGVHSGEWRGWRMDNGGSPLIILDHAEDGEWTRTIHQFTGTWGHDWACAGATCSAPVGKNTGTATSSSRAMFGCNNIHWDPVPEGGNLPPPEIQHEEGMCFNDQSHGAILHWSGYLAPENYDIWNDWIDCWYGTGTVALD